MNKIIPKFFLLLCLFHCLSSFANEDIYNTCGPRPGLIDRLMSDAEKIRLKCIDDVYTRNQEKIKKELEDLHQINKLIKEELPTVAAKISYNMIECSPKSGPVERSVKQVSRCNELVRTQQLVIDRIDELTGWNEKFKSPKTSVDTAVSQPPCPTKELLEKIKPVRYYNRKLYKAWEKCVVLAN